MLTLATVQDISEVVVTVVSIVTTNNLQLRSQDSLCLEVLH